MKHEPIWFMFFVHRSTSHAQGAATLNQLGYGFRSEMVVLQFCDSEVRRDCCDLAHMRSQWGEDRARKISHRLQQLEAMASIDDLSFLPFDSHHVDGAIEVSIDGSLSLLFELPQPTGEVPAMHTIVIRSVRANTNSRAT